MPKGFSFLAISLLLLFGCNHAGIRTHNSVKVTAAQEGTFSYLLSEFPDKGSEEKYPLILVLHGAGENSKSVYKSWAEHARRNSFMVLAPDWMKAFEMKEAKDIGEFYRFLDEVLNRYPAIDKEKMVIAGTSMGGLFAQQLLIENPSYWKAGIFIAFALGHWPEIIDSKEFPPLLFIYGEKDPAYSLAQDRIQQLRRRGLLIRLMVDPEAGHEHRVKWNEQIFESIQEQD